MKEERLDSKTVNRIVSVRITPLPKHLGDALPEVWVTLSDGTIKMLFTYYPDEVSFDEKDLLGLTEEEARLLKFGRDRAHLQS